MVCRAIGRSARAMERASERANKLASRAAAAPQVGAPAQAERGRGIEKAKVDLHYKPLGTYGVLEVTTTCTRLDPSYSRVRVEWCAIQGKSDRGCHQIRSAL